MSGYQPLREEAAEPVYSSKGHTSREAAAAQEKWGKNEIPEEKEPVREKRSVSNPCRLVLASTTLCWLCASIGGMLVERAPHATHPSLRDRSCF